MRYIYMIYIYMIFNQGWIKYLGSPSSPPKFHIWVFLKIHIIAYRSLSIRTSKERSLKLFCSDSAALTVAVKSNGLYQASPSRGAPDARCLLSS